MSSLIVEATRILGAINEEMVVTFRHTAEDGTQARRTVSPYELRAAASGLLLFGWDHVRQAPRQFKLARIEEVEPTPTFDYVPPDE